MTNQTADDRAEIALRAVEAEIGKHLYTNTKNGHREAMFNIVNRVRAALLVEQKPSGRTVEWGLANVYTIARRRLRKLPDGHSERDWWQHVLRISEEAGVKQAGVLRHSLPTEITDGSGV